MTEPRAVLLTLVRGGWATLWPWLILAISFGVNLAFYTLLDDPAISRQSGGLLSLFATALVANLQAWTRILPFTLGLSGTRRGFLGGMAWFVGGQSLIAGVALTAMGLLEERSGGWGHGMRFFRTATLDPLGPLGRLAVLAAVFLAVCAVGGLVGAALARWGSVGIWVLSIGTATLVSAVLLALAWRGNLGDVVTVLDRQGPLQVWIGYPLCLTLLCAGCSWLIIRRSPLR